MNVAGVRKKPSLSGTTLPGGELSRKRKKFFTTTEDHHAPFVWKDRLPYPLKHGVFTRCVSPRRAKQTNGRGWMTSCAAPRRLNKRRRAGVPREDDRDNRNLESLLNSARLASMLDKRNVNLYRRRSSDFFDDFDDPAITSDTVDEGGFHSLIAPTQSLHQPTGVPLPTSTAVSTSPTARFSHESGLRSVASGRAESPTAVFSLSISAAKTKTATKKRSRRSNEEPPPEPIEVSSDESDGEGGRWTPAAPLKRIGTVQIQDDDIASLQPQCWLTGQVINAFLHLLNEMRPPAAKCRVHSFSTFFYTKYVTNGFKGVQRWCADVDLLSKDMLFFPINLQENHWSLVVARVRERVLVYYDSLDIDGASQVKVVRRFLVERLGPAKWTRGPRPRCWKQRNLNDCGVHVCRTAFLLTTGHEAAIDVDSAGDTSRFRRKILRCIVAGSLVK